ncbi:MAG: hypothetical protein AAB358_02710 [Patescibacteria group bacterium]|mgnify:CR=1 FL=1
MPSPLNPNQFEQKKPEVYAPRPEFGLIPEKQGELREITPERLAPTERRPAEYGAAAAPAPAAYQWGEEKYRQVENILEEDLGEIYFQLNPLDQHKFKVKGEEITRAILKIISQPKVKIKKIIELIKDWLKLIPGINRFFLEQTAKIKTDKILSLRKME